MASASLHAPFSVLIKANHLVITQTVDSVSRTLCTLDLRQKPSFYLNNGNVVCRAAQGFEFSLKPLITMRRRTYSTSWSPCSYTIPP